MGALSRSWSASRLCARSGACHWLMSAVRIPFFHAGNAADLLGRALMRMFPSSSHLLCWEGFGLSLFAYFGRGLRAVILQLLLLPVDLDD